MKLTKRYYDTFRNQRVLAVVLGENIPQLCLEIIVLYTIGFSSISLPTAAAMISSILSSFLSIANYIAKRRVMKARHLSNELLFELTFEDNIFTNNLKKKFSMSTVKFEQFLAQVIGTSSNYIDCLEIRKCGVKTINVLFIVTPRNKQVLEYYRIIKDGYNNDTFCEAFKNQFNLKQCPKATQILWLNKKKFKHLKPNLKQEFSLSASDLNTSSDGDNDDNYNDKRPLTGNINMQPRIMIVPKSQTQPQIQPQTRILPNATRLVRVQQQPRAQLQQTQQVQIQKRQRIVKLVPKHVQQVQMQPQVVHVQQVEQVQQVQNVNVQQRKQVPQFVQLPHIQQQQQQQQAQQQIQHQGHVLNNSVYQNQGVQDQHQQQQQQQRQQYYSASNNSNPNSNVGNRISEVDSQYNGHSESKPKNDIIPQLSISPAVFEDVTPGENSNRNDNNGDGDNVGTAKGDAFLAKSNAAKSCQSLSIPSAPPLDIDINDEENINNNDMQMQQNIVCAEDSDDDDNDEHNQLLQNQNNSAIENIEKSYDHIPFSAQEFKDYNEGIQEQLHAQQTQFEQSQGQAQPQFQQSGVAKHQMYNKSGQVNMNANVQFVQHQGQMYAYRQQVPQPPMQNVQNVQRVVVGQRGHPQYLVIQQGVAGQGVVVMPKGQQRHIHKKKFKFVKVVKNPAIAQNNQFIQHQGQRQVKQVFYQRKP